jgi:RecB family exonuclease
VQVGPVSDGVGLDVDLVVVVGLAEGLYPQRQRDDPLLPDEVRALTDGALPTLGHRLDRQQRQLWAALAGARRKVLCFPRGDLRRSSERVPSRWLMPTLRTLLGDDTVQATTWQAAAAAGVAGITEVPSSGTGLSTSAPVTPQHWRVLAALRDPAGTDRRLGPADPVRARAVELRQARRSAAFTRFDGNLSHVDDLPDPTAAAAVSPTALETWTACPHAYLLQHVLRVSPVEEPEQLLRISALEKGSVLHAIYEDFVEEAIGSGAVPAPDEPWSPEQVRRLREIAAQHLDDAERRGVTGFPLLWAQDRAVLEADAMAFAAADDRRRAEQGCAPVATELPFGTGAHPAVELDLGTGRVLRLRGKADRVDRRADGSLVVLDYKTGKAKYMPVLTEADPVAHGHKLQLPVYALAARQRLGTASTPVRTEYWFATRGGGFQRIGYDATDSVMAAARDVLAVIAAGIRGGLFPARPAKESGAYACDYCALVGDAEVADSWARTSHDPLLQPYLALLGKADADD